jgi:hypothetical protein
MDVAIPADKNLEQKESEEKILQEFVHRDITNVEYSMDDCTGNKLGHGDWKRGERKNLEAISGKHSTDSL